MTQYFWNRETIPLEAIALLGVSAKQEGSSPIGFFGTGLKFALSTLLRNGSRIRLYRDGESTPVEFTARPVAIRGQEFEQVFMGAQALGFTTQLGRTWEPWMAWRELHSNALDEQGGSGPTVPTGDWGTVFEVSGVAIEDAAAQRDQIFLPTERLESVAASPILAAYARQGEGRDGFYRGVRAQRLELPALLTYNYFGTADLTEDRTLKHAWILANAAATLVQFHLKDRDLLEQILLAQPTALFEGGLHFSQWDLTSQEFLSVVEQHRRNHHLNESAYKVWLHKLPEEERDKEQDLPLTPFQTLALEAAQELVAELGFTITRSDFLVVKGLGEGVMGRYAEGRVMIAQSTFDQGVVMLAGTLYEELLHKSEGFADESRHFQNFLLNKVVVQAQELRALRRPAGGEKITLAIPNPRDSFAAFSKAVEAVGKPTRLLTDDDIPF